MSKIKNKILTVIVCIIFLIGILPQNFAFESTHNLEYDDNGNLIKDINNYYEYNSLNQLIKVREDNSNGRILEEYFYDNAGNRIKKITYNADSSSKTTYYVDKNFVREVDSETKDTIYYYDGNYLVGKKDSDGNLHFYHPDHLGSTNLVTDSSGNVIEETDYLPFGEITEGGDSRYLFTGQEKDQATGLHYYNARYYSSSLRHFTQPDTIIPDVYDPQSLNRYSYVKNNPIKYIDPSGHSIILSIACVAMYVAAYGAAGYIAGYSLGAIDNAGDQLLEGSSFEDINWEDVHTNANEFGIGISITMAFQGLITGASFNFGALSRANAEIKALEKAKSEISDPSKTVLIGQDGKRVEAAAKELGVKSYQPRKGPWEKTTSSKWISPEQFRKNNAQAIRYYQSKGYKIIDMGPDGSGTSNIPRYDFYSTEHEVLRNMMDSGKPVDYMTIDWP